ncbi:sulfotransferase domain-containing protein [Rhizobium sp. TRM95111]|uniref:sulfotransferase domain-containing protein n=1 Tax=Rhizobium alarense TaxID=2846851 RepID=UPI001F2399AD|nr:sulfotransferase domain-containing protein [Rhizobium alarense]MCF3641695.1 sulfotransferase domain-containing protein [Rhizobium alarense]
MTSLVQRIQRRISKRITLTRYAATADCFLTSYPKSGRTWFRYILSHYFAALSGFPDAVNLHNMFSIVPNFDLDPVRGIPGFRPGDNGKIPRLWVSHLDYRLSLFLNRPVIFMVRDPRDVVVSAYFHATRHKHRFGGTLEDFIEDRDQGVPAICSYLNGWARGIARRRHHVLSYEALSEDAELATRAALEFLGCRHDSQALTAAVEAGRFESMQDRERAEGIPAHDYDRSDTDSLRMRRGRAHGFHDYLNERMIGRVEQICASSLSPRAKQLVAATGFEL